MHQSYWRPWDEAQKELWVREMPRSAFRKEDFDFFSDDLWDYDFQIKFAEWLHHYKRAGRTCCLVGIRTQESFNRWRAIHSEKNYCCYERFKWTRKIADDVYNAYPIYDWRTTDVWVANGRLDGRTIISTTFITKRVFRSRNNALPVRLFRRQSPAFNFIGLSTRRCGDV